ncbi:hypothetical protein HYS31_01020 [Candidatus Woesearchaeota archaeon]|nr:hypothetical protein [Candidatus Woesearchaeota archaeon]
MAADDFQRSASSFYKDAKDFTQKAGLGVALALLAAGGFYALKKFSKNIHG